MIDAEWLRRLEARADAPPERPRVPLRLAVAGATRALHGGGAPFEARDGRSGGTVGSIEPALGERLAAAGLPLRSAEHAWHIVAPSAERIDEAFDAIARGLRDLGLAGAWRGEQLAVRSDAGVRFGAIERAAVRPLGITTNAVHLVAHRAEGGVWVQQRAFDKSTDPGLWDTTMGGLLADRESLAEALARETWEEAGLRLDAMDGLRPFGGFTVRRPVPRGYMIEHTELYEGVVAEAAVPANQDGEVERFECLEPDVLLERLQADAFTLEATLALVAWLRRGAQEVRRRP